jgi:ketosteroid isomerase-like protein
MSTTAPSITDTARAFFDACETGQGWDACQAYCTPDATFAAQAEPLAEMRALQEYADWMQGLLTLVPDGIATVKSFGTDHERGNVCVYGVFAGTHTGEGGPVPPTGKHVAADYVYAMEFDGGRIRHMTKIWNAGWTLRELGWTG